MAQTSDLCTSDELLILLPPHPKCRDYRAVTIIPGFLVSRQALYQVNHTLVTLGPAPLRSPLQSLALQTLSLLISPDSCTNPAHVASCTCVPTFPLLLTQAIHQALQLEMSLTYPVAQASSTFMVLFLSIGTTGMSHHVHP